MKTKSTAKVSMAKSKKPITTGLVIVGVATAAIVWAKLPRQTSIPTVAINFVSEPINRSPFFIVRRHAGQD